MVHLSNVEFNPINYLDQKKNNQKELIIDQKKLIFILHVFLCDSQKFFLAQLRTESNISSTQIFILSKQSSDKILTLGILNGLKGPL